MRRRRGRPGTEHPLCRARPPTGTLIDTAPYPVPVGCVVLEDSPSPVYGAALLMRFGSDPIRGSNPRSSAQLCSRAFGPLPRSRYLPGGTTPRTPRCGLSPANQVVVALADGIHARPAALLVGGARRFAATCLVISRDRRADARSVSALMALGVGHGDVARCIAPRLRKLGWLIAFCRDAKCKMKKRTAPI